MAGYGPAEMVRTPWGRADQLRDRMLRPGPGMPRDEVAQSQRERLFGATVACVSDKGVETTTVADLLELSGVSRSAFYEHFHDKDDCVLATFDAVVAKSMEAIEEDLSGKGSVEQRARRALRTQLEKIAEHSAAAKLCFCDIYEVGERGRLAAEESADKFATLATEIIAEIHDGAELPATIVYAILGGIQSVIQFHFRQDSEAQASDLADDLFEWALTYEAPSAPLRLARRRARPLDGRPSPITAYSQAERIIRALAAGAGERGYPAVTIAEIAARASVSQATFYSHFPDKEAAIVAALDSAGSQMLAVAMPAARRAQDWPNAIRAAIGGLCAFYAAEADLARLAAVEVYSAGAKALQQRDLCFAEIRTLLEPGFEAAPETKPIIADAALGAVWTLFYDQIVKKGPPSLPHVAPLATYMVLAPFLGSEVAVEVANGDGRGSAFQ
jgi:AcrR family transcriptional regulator